MKYVVAAILFGLAIVCAAAIIEGAVRRGEGDRKEDADEE
jgi:hypothetical protein